MIAHRRRCGPLPPQYRRQRRGRRTAGDHPGRPACRAQPSRSGAQMGSSSRASPPVSPRRGPTDEDRLRRAFACGRAKPGTLEPEPARFDQSRWRNRLPFRLWKRL
ncbi:hypothetical protein F2981_07525 [Sinorhizobium meliloti]|nr:hypothetical protein [Sinorhizobium meliloti]